MATKKSASKATTKETGGKKGKLTDGEFAFQSALTTLGAGLPDIAVEQDDNYAKFALHGKPYARVDRDGDDGVIVSFLMPEGAKPKGYTADPKQAGWHKIRLGKDPRAWLAADVGALVGKTKFAIRSVATAGKWKSLVSGGGPYVVMPKSKVERWGEDGEGTDAERATKAPDTAVVIEAADGKALVLGTPDTLYFHSTDDGGIFVRVISFDADDEKVLNQHMQHVPADIWSKLSGTLTVEEQLWAFDSANDGVAIGVGNSLQCDVKAGTYGLAAATYQPDDTTELLLVRLQRA